MVKISKLSFSGWKQFREVSDFEPGNLTVFIGMNGSGKSNIMELFVFLKNLIDQPGRLQTYLVENGYASSVLHYGPDVTKELALSLDIRSEVGNNNYSIVLKYSKPNKLIFKSENYLFTADNPRVEGTTTPRSCGEGHEEAKIMDVDNTTARTILSLINKIQIYQFHNTSYTASMRQASYVEHKGYLRSNGENIASVLYYLKEEHPTQYRKIVTLLKKAFPFFENFTFDVLNKNVEMGWKEEGQRYEFHISQASDGMMRTICLFTLLMLPEKMQPEIILLDEPELGLHPAAINILSMLLEQASEKKQIFVSTQSTQIVDQTDLSNIAVINRKGGVSTLEKPDYEALEFWRDEYSNSQIWDKNLIGGKP